MSYTCKKSTIESYKLRHPDGIGWADISIDANGKSGRIQIASDYGDWQYYWGSCRSEFKDFLAKLDMGYVAGKFGADKFFDVDQTIDTYLETISQQKKTGDITTGEEKQLYDECKDLRNYTHKDEFFIELMDSPALMKFFCHAPELCYKITPGFKMFWEKVWPALLEQLAMEKQDQQIEITGS